MAESVDTEVSDPFDTPLALGLNVRLEGGLKPLLTTLRDCGFSTRDVAKMFAAGINDSAFVPSYKTVQRWYRELDGVAGQ